MTRKEFRELKSGDKVRLAPIEKMRNSEWYVDSLADWAERVVTIDAINFFDEAITVVEDDSPPNPKWVFSMGMIDYKVTEDAETQVERKPAYELLPWDEAKKVVAGTKFDWDDTIHGITEFTWKIIRRENEVITDDCCEEEKKALRKDGLIEIHSTGFSWIIPECCIVRKGNDTPSDVATDKLAEGVFDEPLEETAKERVQKELAELEERTEKLSHAFAPLADKLGTETEAYSLLNLQLGVMRTYADILRRRLAIWED